MYQNYKLIINICLAYHYAWLSMTKIKLINLYLNYFWNMYIVFNNQITLNNKEYIKLNNTISTLTFSRPYYSQKHLLTYLKCMKVDFCLNAL